MSGFGIAASLSPWARDLRSWVADHDPGLEVVLVRDRFAAVSTSAKVVCLGLDSVWVDPALVAELRNNGVAIVGVYASEAEEARWVDWGVRDRMSSSMTAEGMAFLLARLRPVTLAETVDSAEHRPALAEFARVPLVFGGPPGAGAREVALGVAGVLAGAMSTVVVDANEEGGGVARRLGYAEVPNVLTAAHVVEVGGDLTEVAAGWVVGGDVGFDVISGLPSKGEWTQWTPSQAVRTVLAARDRWSATVVVTSPRIEDLRRWGDRYGVSRALLSDSRCAVVGVAEASPRGVMRFAEWIADAHPVHRVSVVVNKVPARSPHLDAQVRERLLSLVGEDRIEIVGSLPFDRRVVRAEWDAVLPRRGAFARGIRRMRSTWLELTAVQMETVR